MRTEHHQLEVVRHGTTTYGPATAANVYSGPYPTWHSAPHIPHDGFLADFLMRNKGFIRG